MSLWSNIKGFLMKQNYDFDDPNISLYNFHPQLRMLYSINGIFFNNRNSNIRFIWPIFNTIVAFVGTGLELMFIHHGMAVEDYTFASECFCYVVILGTVPIVYISILRNRDMIFKQLEHMNQDFLNISKLSSKYRDHFIKGQLLIWQLCWGWFAFCFFTACLYVSNTFAVLVYQSLFAGQNENQERPLIFPVWLPEDDPYRTPNYEMFLYIEIFLITVIFQNFCSYVYMKFHILLHYFNLMDLIIFDLEVVFDDLDASVIYLPKDDDKRIQVLSILNARMKRIVDWHMAVLESVDTVSVVYGPPLVYQVLFSSAAICVMAYQVADHLERGIIHFLFGILLFGIILQLWIPCYLGTLIRNKAFSVGDACWNCGWHKTPLGKMLLLDILIFIKRTQQPLTIQFTALPTLTLETFSSIMSTSYSYFNMLRQSTK